MAGGASSSAIEVIDIRASNSTCLPGCESRVVGVMRCTGAVGMGLGVCVAGSGLGVAGREALVEATPVSPSLVALGDVSCVKSWSKPVCDALCCSNAGSREYSCAAWGLTGQMAIVSMFFPTVSIGVASRSEGVQSIS